jgi:hypothetical protein
MMYSFLGFGALKSNHEIVWGPPLLRIQVVITRGRGRLVVMVGLCKLFIVDNKYHTVHNIATNKI